MPAIFARCFFRHLRTYFREMLAMGVSGELSSNLLVTLCGLFVGFFVGAVPGFLLGQAMGWSPTLALLLIQSSLLCIPSRRSPFCRCSWSFWEWAKRLAWLDLALDFFSHVDQHHGGRGRNSTNLFSGGEELWRWEMEDFLPRGLARKSAFGDRRDAHFIEYGPDDGDRSRNPQRQRWIG